MHRQISRHTWRKFSRKRDRVRTGAHYEPSLNFREYIDRFCTPNARLLLAHARTDTRWFHDWVYGKATDIRFIKGRLKFGDGRQSAPFPSLVGVYMPLTGDAPG